MPPHFMPGSTRVGREDALPLSILLGTTLLVTFPIWRGGYATYIDNPVHIAEIVELSRNQARGWSEMAFAGFPVGTLHSPIWYPLLAFLTRLGVPVGPLYALALLVGFVAVPLSVYVVARTRISPARAGFLAYLVMVQPALLWGIGSPLAGMWTNALATSAIVFLMELYARPRLSPRAHLGASALLAFAMLTHLFVLPVLVFLLTITTTIHYVDDTLTKTEFFRRVGGAAVAVVASAKYTLTFAMTTNPKRVPHQALHPLHVAARLFLPADPIYLGDNRLAEALRWDLHFIDALPIVLLLGLGVAGVLRKPRTDPLARTGSLLAAVLIVALIVDRYRPIPLLGPVSWRLIESARMGLALAAISAVQALPVRRFRAAAWRVAAAVVCVSLSWLWGAPLRHDSPASTEDELVEVERLWDFLKGNARPEWGRLYLQDTFGWEWLRGGLAQSHVLVRTHEKTGIPQLGTYYGVVPYPLRWTLSEFDGFYGTRLPAPEWVLEATDKTNVGAVVTSSRSVYESIERTGAFDLLYQSEHYAVWRKRDAHDDPVNPLSPTNHVDSIAFETGDIRFHLRTEYPGSRVLPRTMWHKFWRLEGVPGAVLRESPEGFLVVDKIPVGSFSVHLRYEPSRVPGVLSAVGIALLLAWAYRLRRDGLWNAEPEERLA
jgi:hypothetical protein